MNVPALDKELGINVYATDVAGIGGAIRNSPEDFKVEEVLVDNSVAYIDGFNERPALGASSGQLPYLLCVLVKRNWDTFLAIKNIAKQLGIDQKRISIAGIKDAKAVTSQHIAIRNVTAEAVKKIDVRDIVVRPIGYFRDELSPFYLLGNRFTITITSIPLSNTKIRRRISQTLKGLEEFGGIPNFFGHQRFGTTRAITHRVGKALVSAKTREAAMLFLSEASLYEHPESRTARKELQSDGDFERALLDFPKQLRFERLMLRYLSQNPKDFEGAFQRLPVKLQALFVQAYQSYLFNRFLSERIQNGLPLSAAEPRDFVVRLGRSGLSVDRTGVPICKELFAEVNLAIKNGRMGVALPLVGFKQRLSEGKMGSIEARVLRQENLTSSSFRVPQIPGIGARGGLRRIISPLRDFVISERFQADLEPEKKSKIMLSFMLLKGSYATVLLREIMKPQDLLKAGF